MSRGVQLFKQTDVTKAIRAVTKAGLTALRVEVEAGKLVIVIANGADDPKSDDHGGKSEWDDV